jgi:hypothetical protein
MQHFAKRQFAERGSRPSSVAGVIDLARSIFGVLNYDPPFVQFSIGVHEADRGKKDTAVII